ncbi:hypothetical protein L1987_07866 [Smallanthus sonchifolius]|uniref:Uncharacterized protein n=1 Tax=Smallanthus sonchifolius TaxID=185202 RepID=A0ACB9JKU3_9ASTR|nr:hypothetical protein L1987_07866 [Smallanthus sonchifolius]
MNQPCLGIIPAFEDFNLLHCLMSRSVRGQILVYKYKSYKVKKKLRNTKFFRLAAVRSGPAKLCTFCREKE